LIVTFVVLGAVALTERGLEENVHETPTGPLQESATFPLKPLVGTTLTVADMLEPSVTVAVEVDALNPKVGAEVVLLTVAIVANKPWAAPVRPEVKNSVLGSPVPGGVALLVPKAISHSEGFATTFPVESMICPTKA
jgi:hypothetical protein